jgi:hypothetical protein
MNQWLWFITACIWAILSWSIMFEPTGTNGEWTTIDSLHVIIVGPLSLLFVYITYRKI